MFSFYDFFRSRNFFFFFLPLSSFLYLIHPVSYPSRTAGHKIVLLCATRLGGLCTVDMFYGREKEVVRQAREGEKHRSLNGNKLSLADHICILERHDFISVAAGIVSRSSSQACPLPRLNRQFQETIVKMYFCRELNCTRLRLQPINVTKNSFIYDNCIKNYFIQYP